IGIDLSLGGDETVITFCRGNKILRIIGFRITDATKVAERISSELKFYTEIEKTHEYIFADDGGSGRAIIDILNKMGWINIRRVLNQSKARSRTGQYRNRGCALYFKFSRLIQECIIILPDDSRLYNQLISRHYKQSDALGGL